MDDPQRRLRLAYAIRTARERRGLTPPQLAERLHKGRGTINRWEDGSAAPSLLDLGPLCEALGVDPRLFADLPAIPVSPVEEYLVEQAVTQGVAIGAGRAAARRAGKPTP